MREIKFRGKRVYNGEWVYGYFYSECENHYIIEDTQKKNNSILYRNISNIIDPETVGQFTGLTDKNGKEIYEGDIVIWIDSDKIKRFDIVSWKNGGLILCNQNYTVGVYLFNELEIIGNIHDNPELINATPEANRGE